MVESHPAPGIGHVFVGRQSEMAELEAAFGLNPQEAMAVVTQLMEAGKVERQGKVYIAV